MPKIPRFGSLVTYVPKKIEKHSSRSRRGIVLGYAQMPGGYVTDEFIVVPLECFTKGLKTVNLVVSRDVRIPSTPTFQIKEWNTLAETRSYIEKFKPLCGESYYENIWAKAIDIKIKNGIPEHREIIVLRDGEIHEVDDPEPDNEDAVIVVRQPIVQPIAESVPMPCKIIDRSPM